MYRRRKSNQDELLAKGNVLEKIRNDEQKDNRLLPDSRAQRHLLHSAARPNYPNDVSGVLGGLTSEPSFSRQKQKQKQKQKLNQKLARETRSKSRRRNCYVYNDKSSGIRSEWNCSQDEINGRLGISRFCRTFIADFGSSSNWPKETSELKGRGAQFNSSDNFSYEIVCCCNPTELQKPENEVLELVSDADCLPNSSSSSRSQNIRQELKTRQLQLQQQQRQRHQPQRRRRRRRKRTQPPLPPPPPPTIRRSQQRQQQQLEKHNNTSNPPNSLTVATFDRHQVLLNLPDSEFNKVENETETEAETVTVTEAVTEIEAEAGVDVDVGVGVEVGVGVGAEVGVGSEVGAEAEAEAESEGKSISETELASDKTTIEKDNHSNNKQLKSKQISTGSSNKHQENNERVLFFWQSETYSLMDRIRWDPVVGLILCVIIIITFVGNVLVCLSVIKVRKLRHPSNYLLVSLAISDLCVAIFVMPFGLYQSINDKWQLGRILCNVYVVSDVTSCTASILNLCVISIDRYLSITKPLTYCVERTTRLMMGLIAAVWICACLISVPPLLISGNEYGTNEEPRCEVNQSLWYQLYATCISFYIPLIVMICLYFNIYTAAKKVVEAEQRARIGLHFNNNLNITANANVNNSNNNDSDTGTKNIHQIAVMLNNNGAIPAQQPQSQPQLSPLQQSTQQANRHHHHHHTPHRHSQQNSKPSVMKERKASITLGIIMSAFTICWLPFFIIALLRPFSEKVNNLPRTFVLLTLWLGYANSMLNPIIYVTFHHDFRNAFKQLVWSF